jgi:hypothetical protein
MSEKMVADQKTLGQYADEFIIFQNKKEANDNWAKDDPAWKGRSSMSPRHVLLCNKDLSWRWFNVLVAGLDSAAEALDKIISMREAALHFVRNDTSMEWSPNIGLYFNCYPYTSVNALLLHIVDLAETGPSFDALQHVNLPVEDVIEVLRAERAELRDDAEVYRTSGRHSF